MRETLLLDVPHRQIVFTIPRMLPIFFRCSRRLLGDLCRSASFKAILVELTSIGGRVYPLLVKGGTDSKLFRKECRRARTRKSLSIDSGPDRAI
jgi:hypothetical protein